jgi:crotonobetainyl-CoA:carnitine CoA-transferase CaiB-like acyl-CoA transferase
MIILVKGGDMESQTPPQTPFLQGVRVLELGSMYAAPTAGRMLRDFGADVVKVEQPGQGDYARQWQPRHENVSLGFARLNAGKRSVGIDLHTDEGRAVVRELAATCDVVIESFRPGRLERWGLGYDVLRSDNPGVVLTRVSGFGQTGPYRERPGFGTVAEVASGFGFLNGWPDTPPTAPPFGFADSIAGISAAFGTAMALYRRGVDGTGSEVDVALYEPLMFILGDPVLTYTATGRIMQREGNSSGSASPRGIYQAGDGAWLAIAASNQAIAMRLFDAMGRSDLREHPDYATNDARMRHNEALQEIVRAWVGSMPRAQVLGILEKFEVVGAAVNDSSDIANDPHFLSRTLVPLTGTILQNALVPGPIMHAQGRPEPRYDGVPSVGQHTRDVLSDRLSMDDSRLAELARIGVITLQD